MKIEEQAAMYIRAMYGPEPVGSADRFSTDFLPDYNAADTSWVVALFQRAEMAERLRAQRPLIHNGKKPRG